MGDFQHGYALVIGIVNYPKVKKLPKVVLKDADDFAEVLQAPNYGGYPGDHVQLLKDEQATAAGMRRGFKWLADQTGEEDTAVIFFSGHGGRIETEMGTTNYLIPFDADLRKADETAISDSELTQLLNQINAGRLLVLFDCCHSGGIGETKDVLIPQIKSGLDANLYDQLSAGHGRAIMASSRTEEVSWVLPGMENSLFTHYLLNALRGEGRGSYDGLTRVFDLFDYVSEQVPAKEPNQHPVFKAKLENNFPIALYLGGKSTLSQPIHARRHTASPQEMAVQENYEVTLTAPEREVLEGLFGQDERYERVVIKQELSGGFSGGRVLIVRPLGSERAYLPVVVKMGPVDLIQQEWAAFDHFIRGQVPNVTAIEGTPAYSQNRTWAGLRYQLVGMRLNFYTESFKSFCRRATAADIAYVLEKQLFPGLHTLWQNGQHYQHEVLLGDSYDPLLPVNVIVEAGQSAGEAQYSLTPETARTQTCRLGDVVELSDLIVTEVDLKVGALTLNPTPIPKDGLPRFYRLRLMGVKDLSACKVGEPLSDSIVGVVRTTRQSRLQQEMERLFSGTAVTTENITLPNDQVLPNPLQCLPKVMQSTYDMRVGTIHGDLNLENILVEHDWRTFNMHIIDFTTARQDNVMHDLQRLETGLWLYMAPETLQDISQLPALLAALYQQDRYGQHTPPPAGLEKIFAIIGAVRQAANLTEEGHWEAYYQGLTIYLLGALKFKNLDEVKTEPVPKKVAVVLAAGLQWLVTLPPPPLGPTADPLPSPDPERENLNLSRQTPPPERAQLKLTSAQLNRMRELLQECEPFETQRQLRAFFVHPYLKPWRRRLSDEPTLTARVDGVIALLHNKRHTGYGNKYALILLLCALREDINIDDNLHRQLSTLIDAIGAECP